MESDSLCVQEKPAREGEMQNFWPNGDNRRERLVKNAAGAGLLVGWPAR